MAAQSISSAPPKRQWIVGQIEVISEQLSEVLYLLFDCRPTFFVGSVGVRNLAIGAGEDLEQRPYGVRPLGPTIHTAEFGIIVCLRPAAIRTWIRSSERNEMSTSSQFWAGVGPFRRSADGRDGAPAVAPHVASKPVPCPGTASGPRRAIAPGTGPLVRCFEFPPHLW